MRLFTSLLLFCFYTQLFAEGFISGTSVKTKDKSIPIEQIQPQDKILSCNFTDKCVERTVLATAKFQKQNIIALDIGYETIFVAEDHKFFLPEEKSWIQAKDLQTGDLLLTENNDYTAITKITALNKTQTTHSLSVENNHNFYISEKGLLVHNFFMAIPFAIPIITITFDGVVTWFGGSIVAAATVALASTVADVIRDKIDDHDEALQKEDDDKPTQDSQEMLGENGVRVDSKTLWKGKGKGKNTERIDVENPAPGKRPGQIHYQNKHDSIAMM